MNAGFSKLDSYMKNIKNPSLSELMDELELWWKEIDPLGKFETETEKITSLLVKKGIS